MVRSLNNIIKEVLLKASGDSDFNREKGGKIISSDGTTSLMNLPNFSHREKRFYGEIPEADLYEEELKGFWHTHPSYSFPSPPDFYQMLKLNLMFKKNFLMVIIGKRRISITKFKCFVLPLISFTKIRN